MGTDAPSGMKSLQKPRYRDDGEQPFFTGEGDQRLFAFLHRAHSPPRAVLVFCHAFAEEKLWSHRVYVTFARDMARLGFAVLRFDMRGTGDSSLDFEAATIETRIADTLRAIDIARERKAGVPVVLMGHRFGGMMAALAAERASVPLKGIVLWDPIMDGEEYLGALLRSNLATQMATQGKVTRTREVLMQAMLDGETVVVDGYGLTPALCRGLIALKWAEMPQLLRTVPTLILEVPKGPQTDPSPELAALAADRPNLTLDLCAELPFWRETRQFHHRAGNFTVATEQWLGRLV
jgi:uncharacterized protein